MIMKPIRLFLDSSVVIAGLASPGGGSNRILLLCELGLVKPYISEQILSEVLRNVEKKLPGLYGKTYFLFRKLPFQLVEPTDKSLSATTKLINEKDAPVLAAAMCGKVDWLVTLDKHFLEQKWHEDLAFKIGTPGLFLQQWPYI